MEDIVITTAEAMENVVNFGNELKNTLPTAEQAAINITRFSYLLSKDMLWMNLIDSMVYHDVFETITEYNGFVAEC